MTCFRPALLILFFCLPLSTTAATSPADLPEGTIWYVHADLQQMRSTDSGVELSAWLDDEVFLEINDELGIDVNKEVDRITAFSNNMRGAVIVVEGDISETSRDKLLTIAVLEGDLETLSHNKKTYYHVGDGNSDEDDDNDNDIESLEDSAYVTFAIDGYLIIASDEDQLKALMDAKGKIAGVGNQSGAIFVLTAEKEFVQAGLRTKGFDADDIDWDSNIVRNIEQAALLIADQDGMIAIEAQLISGDPRMAQSVASIINGLISLQVFNTELDPELARLLQNTKVSVDDKVLSISTVVNPSMIVDIVAD